MLKRSEPRAIPPESRTIYAVDLERGRVHLRRPDPFTAALLLPLAGNITAADLRNVQGFAAASTNARTMSAYAAVVGACWHHRDLDLETPQPVLDGSPGDEAALLTFGRAVLRETHEDGWTATEIATLWGHVVKNAIGSAVDMREVAKVLGFFGQTPAAPASSGAPSSSPSSVAGAGRMDSTPPS